MTPRLWVAGILIVASVLATPSAAPENRMGEAAGLTLAGAAGAAQRQLGAPQQPADLVTTTTVPASVEHGAPLTLAGGSPPAVSHGRASWFAAKGYQGAVPWWRAGQSPVWATLSRFADGRTYSVTLLITGFCACLAEQPGERLIDVSPAAFRALGAPLSVGLIRVQMQVPVQGPRLPATDTEGSARDGG